MQLAQVNVARMQAAFTEPVMAGFIAVFDSLMQMAESSPGFRWRLRHPGPGHAVVAYNGEHGARQEGDHEPWLLAVNVTVWADYQSLHTFVYRSCHGRLLTPSARRRWFLPTPQPSTALWWIADDAYPSLEQSLARLDYLRRNGPTPRAFSLLRQYDPGGRPVPGRTGR